MKSRITITKWLAGKSYWEAREDERRAEERWHVAGMLAGLLIAVVVAIVAIGYAASGS